MSTADLAIPGFPDWDDAAPPVSVAVSLQKDYEDERLSAREIEALSPVLAELAIELLNQMSLDRDTE